MIYAIRAVGTSFIKFGRATHVGRRLVELDQSSPLDLEVLVFADWPNGAETGIHRLLQDHRHKGEWFTNCDLAKQIIEWMKAPDVGLAKLQHELSKSLGNRNWLEPTKTKDAAIDLTGIERRQEERKHWWRQHGPATSGH